MSSGADESLEARLAPVILCLLAVIAGLGVVTLGLALALPPDTPGILPEVARQFAVPWYYLRPEPSERFIFFFDLLLLPALVYVVARRLPAVWSPRLFRISVVALAAIAFVVLLSDTFAQVMLGTMMSALPLPVAAAIAAVCIVLSLRWRWPDVGRGWTARIALAVCVLVAAFLAFSWRTLDIRSLEIVHRHWFHLDLMMYPMAESVAGRAPLADYPSQYGFFGAFLAPWFHVVGLSVWTFTLTMNALQLAALTGLVLLVFREIRNLPMALGACAALFWVNGGWRPLRFDPDPYFQYTPVRLLFPAVSALLVAGWLRQPTTRRAMIISSLAGISLIWNVDSGIAVTGSWLGLLGYRVLSSLRGPTEQRKATLRMLGVAAGVVLLPVLIFGVWVVIRAGGRPAFGVFDSMRAHYGGGLNMLPLPPAPHPWQLVAAVYLLGLIVGTYHAMQRIVDLRAALMLYLSLLGFGLLVYYQGRSHDEVLMDVAWPAVFLVFLMADWALRAARDGRLGPLEAIAVGLPALTLGFHCALLIARDAPGMARQWRHNLAGANAPTVQANLEFLRAHTGGQRDVVFLARFQGIYLAELRLGSSVPGTGAIETWMHAEGERTVGEIAKLAPRQIFVGEPFLKPRASNPFNTLMPLLAKDYHMAAQTTNDTLRLYVRNER